MVFHDFEGGERKGAAPQRSGEAGLRAGEGRGFCLARCHRASLPRSAAGLVPANWDESE